MAEFRCLAADIIGIASVNAAVYRTHLTEPSDEIIVVVPEGMRGRADVVPTEAGNVLLIQGESANISGGLDFREGINLQAGTVHGQLSSNVANQMIQIKLPPGCHPQTINWSGGVTNWS